MVIEENGHRFSLDLTNKPENGIIGIAIEMAVNGFSGWENHISIWVEELKEFIETLNLLEKSRQGVATLASVNCVNDEICEMRLVIRSLDRLGHMGLQVRIRKGWYVGEIYSPLELSAGFEFDPTKLPYILSEFVSMQKYIHNTQA